MSRPFRKFVAVLMLLWLPLFSGSALAATVRMQMQHGGCHEVVAAQMEHCHMAGHHQHHAKPAAPADHHGPACDTCEVCHLVVTGYLAVVEIAPVAVSGAARDVTPYLVAFESFTSAPLVPPPLTRA